MGKLLINRSENFDTFGMDKDSVLLSLTQNRIGYFDSLSGQVIDILKKGEINFIDNNTGYFEFPILYKNEHGLRNLCIQWGKATLEPSEVKTVSFTKRFSAIYNIQATSENINPIGVVKQDLGSFNLKNSDTLSNVGVFWFAIGQSE